MSVEEEGSWLSIEITTPWFPLEGTFYRILPSVIQVQSYGSDSHHDNAA